MTAIAVMTTTPSADEAHAIASSLVERKLAACVHIVPIESVYSWEGEVQNDSEYRLLAKTTEARYADVEAAILELHSYDLPAVVAFHIAGGYMPYLDWVEANAQGDALS